jgi:hypothetical protein
MPTEDLGQKKGVIKEIKPIVYNEEHQKDQRGNYKHKVTMDNGDVGTCNTKDKEASAWKEGSEVKYTLKQWTSDDGTQKSFFLQLVRDNPGFAKGGAAVKGSKEYKCEAIMVAASNAASSVAMKDNCDENHFKVYFQAYLKPMYEEIDKLYAQS